MISAGEAEWWADRTANDSNVHAGSRLDTSGLFILPEKSTERSYQDQQPFTELLSKDLVHSTPAEMSLDLGSTCRVTKEFYPGESHFVQFKAS